MISVMGVIFFIHFDHQIQPQGKNRHDPCLRLLARAFQNKSIYLVFFVSGGIVGLGAKLYLVSWQSFFFYKMLIVQNIGIFHSKSSN